MRVAVSGAGGRLGRALVAALEESPYTGPSGPVAWDRSQLDLDEPEAIHGLLDAERVEVLVHAAAWTDVDGCAREPELAMRRNGDAAGVIAAACARRGVDLVLISTNEVFDGRRTDGRGYVPGDPVAPANSYGASKLAGERAAVAAFATSSGRLSIVRTAWLFGPPGRDFPAKILEAADRAEAGGTSLRVVADEFGTPTSAADLAEAIAAMIGQDEIGGLHHIVNEGVASRATWAREVLRLAGRRVPVEDVAASTWRRSSTPPAWGVLQATTLPAGEPLRPWRLALADYLPWLLRARRAAGAPA